VNQTFFFSFGWLEWGREAIGIVSLNTFFSICTSLFCKEDLKQTLEGMVDVLFPGVEKRWNEDYFPFTEPSFELEVFYEGAWLEVNA